MCLDDIWKVFELPYSGEPICGNSFDYSDRVTPIIYAASLGYSQLVAKLATYYGKEGLIIPCEDNSKYDGTRVAMLNLAEHDKDMHEKLKKDYNILNQDLFLE